MNECITYCGCMSRFRLMLTRWLWIWTSTSGASEQRRVRPCSGLSAAREGQRMLARIHAYFSWRLEFLQSSCLSPCARAFCGVSSIMPGQWHADLLPAGAHQWPHACGGIPILAEQCGLRATRFAGRSGASACAPEGPSTHLPTHPVLPLAFSCFLA